MKKLKKGDYVVNLSKQQFDKLMELQPLDYIPYNYEGIGGVFFNGLYISLLRFDSEKISKIRLMFCHNCSKITSSPSSVFDCFKRLARSFCTCG